MENLKEEIDEIADEDEKKKKLEKYDKLRKNLKNATGISEIIQQNVKKGGKYVIFIPVSTDEKGKESKDKIKEYEERMKEYLKDSGIDAEYYSMLGFVLYERRDATMRPFFFMYKEGASFITTPPFVLSFTVSKDR